MEKSWNHWILEKSKVARIQKRTATLLDKVLRKLCSTILNKESEVELETALQVESFSDEANKPFTLAGNQTKLNDLSQIKECRHKSSYWW